MLDLKKGFGILTLLTAVLVIWHQNFAGGRYSFVWFAVNVLFVLMPVLLYLLMNCDFPKGKSFEKGKLDHLILILLLVIASATAYQFITGKSASDDSTWNYINACVIILYSFIAGRFIKTRKTVHS